MSEPLQVAEEILTDMYDRLAELPNGEGLMAASYIREHLTAYIQCPLAKVYYGIMKEEN